MDWLLPGEEAEGSPVLPGVAAHQLHELAPWLTIRLGSFKDPQGGFYKPKSGSFKGDHQ